MNSKNHLPGHASKTLDRICADENDVFLKMHITAKPDGVRSHLNCDKMQVLPFISAGLQSPFSYSGNPLSQDDFVSWSRSLFDSCVSFEKQRTFLEILSAGRTFVSYFILRPDHAVICEPQYALLSEIYGQELSLPPVSQLQKLNKRRLHSLNTRMRAMEEKRSYGDYLHIENMQLLEGFRVVENGVSQQLFPSFDHYDSGTKDAALLLKALEKYATR